MTIVTVDAMTSDKIVPHACIVVAMHSTVITLESSAISSSFNCQLILNSHYSLAT